MSTPAFDPQPCCGGEAAAASDLVATDLVCATVAGNSTTVIRQVLFGPDGTQLSVTFTSLNGAVIVPDSWTPGECAQPSGDTEVTILCDLAGGNSVSFLRRQTFNAAGAVTSTVDTTPGGAPYVVGGPVASCASIDTEPQVLCDVSAAGVSTPFLRRYSYSAAGLLVGTNDTQLNGSTGYVPTGTVMDCGTTTTTTIAGSTAAVTTLSAATTGNGTTVDFGNAKSNVSLFILVNGTVTAGAVDLQASQDGTNWVRVVFGSPLTTGVNQYLGMSGGAFRWFRGVIADTVTGGGSVTATLMFA